MLQGPRVRSRLHPKVRQLRLILPRRSKGRGVLKGQGTMTRGRTLTRSPGQAMFTNPNPLRLGLEYRRKQLAFLRSKGLAGVMS